MTDTRSSRKRPSIAVVMPNYNHGSLVGEALESIMSQSLCPEEVVVVDDASTDESAAVLHSFARRYSQIRIQQEPTNTGLRAHYRAVGEVAASTSSSYLYMASADDNLLPGFFARAVEVLEAFPQAGYAFAIPTFIDSTGAPVLDRDLPAYHSHAHHVDLKTPCYLSPQDLLKRLSRQPWFIAGTVSVLFRTKALAEAGPPDVSLGLLADWFVVHAVGLRHGMCYIPEPLVAFRIMPESWGSNVVNRPEMAIGQYARVLSRMRLPEWRSVFPAAFVESKRREFSYTLFRGALVNWQSGYLRDLRRLLPPAAWHQRGLLWMLRYANLLQWALLRAYCSGRVARGLAENRA